MDVLVVSVNDILCQPWCPYNVCLISKLISDAKKCSQKDVNKDQILTLGWPKPDIPESSTDIRLLSGPLYKCAMQSACMCVSMHPSNVFLDDDSQTMNLRNFRVCIQHPLWLALLWQSQQSLSNSGVAVSVICCPESVICQHFFQS